MKHYETYCDAVNNWGIEAQAGMTMTECGELIAELGRYYIQGRKDENAVIDEIADVQIMINQLTLIFGENEVANRVDEKVGRLAKLIEANPSGTTHKRVN